MLDHYNLFSLIEALLPLDLNKIYLLHKFLQHLEAGDVPKTI